uniref:Uncharacterized protein n=1 Tax=Gorilla gorilla gorilla TaxID=9595 RepID=A0A2I2YD95_GORGO|nr:putative uncharacterized protein encoded by LINC02913 [Gorilla gorilla gorilla]
MAYVALSDKPHLWGEVGEEACSSLNPALFSPRPLPRLWPLPGTPFLPIRALPFSASSSGKSSLVPSPSSSAHSGLRTPCLGPDCLLCTQGCELHEGRNHMAVHSCVARAWPGAPQEVRHLNPLLCDPGSQVEPSWPWHPGLEQAAASWVGNHVSPAHRQALRGRSLGSALRALMPGGHCPLCVPPKRGCNLRGGRGKHGPRPCCPLLRKFPVLPVHPWPFPCAVWDSGWSCR